MTRATRSCRAFEGTPRELTAFRSVGTWVAIVFSLVLWGCVPTSNPEAPEQRYGSGPPVVDGRRRDSTLESSANRGENQENLRDASGIPVWAEDYEGLIVGMDGVLYEGYLPGTIERVQRALVQRGLYPGPVNGVLDAPTMEAIYVFQNASYGLTRCGVPTPRTRRMLERGSHT